MRDADTIYEVPTTRSVADAEPHDNIVEAHHTIMTRLLTIVIVYGLLGVIAAVGAASG